MTYLLDQIWLVFCWEHHWESLLSPHHHFDGERWSAWESPPSPAVLHMHLHHSYSQNERSVCKTRGEGNTERNQLHVYIAEFVFYKKKLFWNSFLGHLSLSFRTSLKLSEIGRWHDHEAKHNKVCSNPLRFQQWPQIYIWGCNLWVYESYYCILLWCRVIHYLLD